MEVKQSGLSPTTATCSGGNRVLVSHNIQQIIEVTGKRQWRTTILPVAVSWPETPQASLAACAR